MSYLLDTNVVSEATKARAAPSAARWLGDVVGERRYVSAISIAELHFGIERSPHGRRRDDLRAWFRQEVLGRFGDRILPVDQEIALAWGALGAELFRRGTPMPAFDQLIAATALVHDLTLVTRNIKDFQHTGIALLNPWDE